MSSRMIGAGIGLLVSAVCIYFILSRLLEAGVPMPTSVQLRNATAQPVSVDEVALSAQRLPGLPLTLAAAGLPFVSKPLPLPPGRPVSVSVRIGAAGATASCTLDARPRGSCVVDAAFDGGAGLQCAYDCKTAAPPQ